MSGSWHPSQDAHAIDAVAIILFFNNDFPSALKQKLREVLRGTVVPMGLSIVNPVMGVLVDQNEQPRQTELGTQFLSNEGLSAKRQAAGHFRELLSLEENSIGYRATYYEGWDHLLARFNHIISTISPMIKDVMALSRIRLEYTDRFIWKTTEQLPPDTATLLKPDSEMVAPYVHKSVAHWHSNSGVYLPSEKLGEGRILQVSLQSAAMANIESGENALGVHMVTAREDRYEEGALELAISSYDIMDQILIGMHGDLIDALEAVLTSEMSNAIGLRSKTSA